MNALSSHFHAVPARPMTPGGYMRDCRQRAKVSIAEVAAAIALRHADRQQARADIVALERNRPGDYSRLVKALRDHRAFPFDLGRFVTLASETADHTMGEAD